MLLLLSCPLVHPATREVRLMVFTLWLRRPMLGALYPHRPHFKPLCFLLYLWLLIKAVPVSPNENEAYLCYFRPKMEGMMS